jgi:hypothetical protein
MKFIPHLALLALFAGTLAPAAEPLSTTLTVGYDSRYVLYGYRLSDHLYHADVYLSQPINERVTLWGGSWAGALTDGTYSEIDLYSGVDFQLTEKLFAGLAYSYFSYLEVPWEADDSHEVSGHLTYYTGPFSLSLRDLYDAEGKGHLARAIATYDRSISDRVALSLSAEYGYSFDYYLTGNGGNHALFRANLPIQLTERLTLSPFIAQSLVLDVLDSFEQDQFYGGANVSLSF